MSTATKTRKTKSKKTEIAEKVKTPKATKTPKTASKVVKPRKKATSKTLSQDQIAEQAYFLWLERGCAHGHESEDWVKAESILKGSFTLKKKKTK